MAYIYGLKCVCHPGEGIRYVGLTSRTIARRLAQHRSLSKRNERLPVYKWIAKHGRENIEAECLEECSEETVGAREGHWISRLNPDLNVDRFGGIGNRSPWTDEQKKKLSLRTKGVPKPAGFGQRKREYYACLRAERPEPPRKRRKNLSPDAVLAVLALKGICTAQEVALIFGISKSAVCHIWNGFSWPEITGIAYRGRNDASI